MAKKVPYKYWPLIHINTDTQIREAAGECFDDLGLEQPQQGGG